MHETRVSRFQKLSYVTNKTLYLVQRKAVRDRFATTNPRARASSRTTFTRVY